MRIHFIAIGGSAMHNLAIALSRKGFEVTGSDDEIFEPSKSRLNKQGLLPNYIGWNTEIITSNLDAVIVGMHARQNNPELLKAQDLGLKVYSYPEYIYEQTRDKKRVVIGGSHGKTTITSMILHVLHYHSMDVDYMVGAQLEGFDCMVKLTTDNKFAILEGDEYLSSPTDLRPKFHLYQPDIALISGIAWDHINVFKTYDIYLEQFTIFMNKIESGGVCIYNATDDEVKKVVSASERKDIQFIPYHLPKYTVDEFATQWEFGNANVKLKIFGQHNMVNLMGAVAVLKEMGISEQHIIEALPSFTGASKRLETVGVNKENSFYMYKDFAHAPSKLKATVDAVGEKHKKQQLIACMELHTFSSLNAAFFPQYKGAMDEADQAHVYFNPSVVAHKKLPSIDSKVLFEAFANPNVKVWTNKDEMLKAVLQNNFKNAVLLMMSSGNFDGIQFEKVFNEITAEF